MPLSIGLFGAWGAGKTHFIDLLDERLDDLSKHPGEVFYSRIVQIRFNAWHYLDTNLWANLVCEIFDQLFQHLEKDKGEASKARVAKLREDLTNQSALAAEAREALERAKAARVKAEDELREATMQRVKQENKVRELLDDLGILITKDATLHKQLQDMADSLGLPKLKTSFDELEKRVTELKSLQGRIQTITWAVLTGPKCWRRYMLLVVAITAPIGIGWLSIHGWQPIKDLLDGAGKTVVQAGTAIGLFSAWLSAQVKTGNSLVCQLEKAYTEVKKIRNDRETRDEAQGERKLLASRKNEEEIAQHVLSEAEEKIKSINAELADLAPGRQLMRFLKARASADDYRRHLELVSLIRKDFEQLSNLLLSSRSDSGALPSQESNLYPQIDRIVLYIDDLDRCQTERVIEVLEAVHLLLAFPLFAVVVAVDPRWLRQSLLDKYPRLLGGATNGSQDHRRVGRPATPHDYLEKIFQVPFYLPRLEKDGFDTLINNLLRSKATLSVTNYEKPGTPSEIEPVALGTNTVFPPAPQVGTGSTTSNTANESDHQQIKPAPVLTENTLPKTSSTLESTPLKPIEDIKRTPDKPDNMVSDPKRLVLSEKEISEMHRFQPFFQTPRAVKRLANTYCLIRVGVREIEWTNFLGTEDVAGVYRCPMLLLAVSSAFPALARPWLLWLLETSPSQWQLSEGDLKALSAKYEDTTTLEEWNELAHGLNQVDLQDWAKPEQKLLGTWVPLVARYSF